jgi:hypothetical protein
LELRFVAGYDDLSGDCQPGLRTRRRKRRNPIFSAHGPGFLRRIDHSEAPRSLSIVPPEDPLLFYARSHARGFSPLVTNADGFRSIGRGGEPRSPQSLR